MKNFTRRVLIILFAVLTVMSCFTSPIQAKNSSVIMAQTATNPRLVLTRIMTNNSVEMKNTTASPLILDKEGYRYEPLNIKIPFSIKNDVEITADNITFCNAIIEGNLYISANNSTLNDLTINGTVFINPGINGAWTLNNVTAKNIEVNDANVSVPPEQTDIDADSSVQLDQPANELGKPETSSVLKAFLEIITVADYNDKLLVVNKARSLPSNWKPKDLIAVKVPYRGRSEAKYMRKEAADALIALFAKANKDKINLVAVSGYRSYELQKVIYAKNVTQLGEEIACMISALSGRSEHQTGLAMDISSKAMGYKLDQSFGNTREGKWLSKNSAEFGFIIRYPKGKEAITGYTYEPWHMRYIGKDIAIEITNKDTTLEEYFEIKG